MEVRRLVQEKEQVIREMKSSLMIKEREYGELEEALKMKEHKFVAQENEFKKLELQYKERLNNAFQQAYNNQKLLQQNLPRPLTKNQGSFKVKQNDDGQLS